MPGVRRSERKFSAEKRRASLAIAGAIARALGRTRVYLPYPIQELFGSRRGFRSLLEISYAVFSPASEGLGF